MILRALRLRDFAGLVPGAEVPRFDERITVIHGPNEAGKTTLLNAIQFALYQRYNTTGDAIAAVIAPAGRSLAPSIDLDFEAGGDTWRIEKRFLKDASARLSRLEDGTWRPFATGREAEEALRQILGGTASKKGLAGADDWGLGQILLAPQGSLVLDGLNTEARDRLHAALGRVAVEPRARGIEARIDALWLEAYTPQGKEKKESEISRLRARLAEREEILRAARAAVARFDALSRAVADATRLVADDDAAIAGAEAQAAAAEADARRAAELDLVLEAAARQTAEARRNRDDARLRQREIGELEARLRSLDEQLAGLRKEEANITSRRETAERRLAETRRDAADTARKKEGLRERERDAADAGRLAEIARSLSDRVERRKRHDDLAAALAGHERTREALRSPSEVELREVRKQQAEAAKLEAKLGATELRVVVRAERDLVIDEPVGGARPLESLSETTIRGAAPLRIVLRGMAQLEVHGPVEHREIERIRDRLADVGREIRRRLDPFGTEDMTELERRRGEAQALETAIAGVRSRMEEIFKTRDALDRDRDEGLREETERKAILERHPPWRADPPDGAMARILREEAEGDLRRLREREAGERQAVETLEAALIAATTECARMAAAIQTLDVDRSRATGALGVHRAAGVTPEERATRLREAENRVLAAEEDEKSARGRREALPENPSRVEELARSALGKARAAREQRLLAGERARTELQLLVDEAPWARLAAVEEEIDELRRRKDAEERRLAALALLRDELARERHTDLDRIVGPVRTRVERMARHVMASGLGVRLGESLLPESFPLAGGGELGGDQLSFGTRDQFALLLRLALAELVAEHAGRHALLLDDPLVNTDSLRRLRLLDIIARATRELQIVIFTCHPESYAALPDALFIEMATARSRAEASGP